MMIYIGSGTPYMRIIYDENGRRTSPLVQYVEQATTCEIPSVKHMILPADYEHDPSIPLWDRGVLVIKGNLPPMSHTFNTIGLYGEAFTPEEVLLWAAAYLKAPQYSAKMEELRLAALYLYMQREIIVPVLRMERTRSNDLREVFCFFVDIAGLREQLIKTNRDHTVITQLTI